MLQMMMVVTTTMTTMILIFCSMIRVGRDIWEDCNKNGMMNTVRNLELLGVAAHLYILILPVCVPRYSHSYLTAFCTQLLRLCLANTFMNLRLLWVRGKNLENLRWREKTGGSTRSPFVP